MGLFGKKKKKPEANNKKAERPPQAAVPAAPPPPQQMVKIVGDSKQVTTTRRDAQGRETKETKISTLTPAERKQYGVAPKAARPTPVQQNIQVEPYNPPAATIQAVPQAPQLKRPPQQQQRPPQQRPSQQQQPPQQPPPQQRPPPDRVSQADTMDNSTATIETTRELVKQFIADIWNRGEVDLIPTVCHPSLRFNGHVGMDRVGHEGFARMVTTVREALTDYHCEIHSMVVETNKAFCRLRFTGKHTGNLLGYPPTGKTVAWMGASEFTCKNGKILKVWELGDVKSLEEQLRADV